MGSVGCGGIGMGGISSGGIGRGGGDGIRNTVGMGSG